MARVAIITGSDSGIGKASAVRLARDGFDIGVTWHNDREGGEGTVREVEALGRRAALAELDVTDFEAAPDTIEALARELGGLDVFVNNAGGGETFPFLDFPLEAWQRVLDLNLTGAFACGQRAARIMVEAGTKGRIVNITSVHEHIPLREQAAYCAAKGGLGLLTKAMALELGEHGIAVNSIAPGEIATPLTGAGDEDPSDLERPALPAGRPGSAYEIAELVAWLAHPDSRYATGSSFVVDGGLMLTAGEFNRQTAVG